jgi:hypothetical protein
LSEISSGWSDISSATDSTYALTAAEEGRYVRVVVSYIDGQGFSESITTASIGVGLTDDGDAVFAISGTPTVGQMLSATLLTPDPDGNPVAGYAYRWQRSSDGSTWGEITGATSSTDALSAVEEVKQVRVLVSYVDGQSFPEAVPSVLYANSVTVPDIAGRPSPTDGADEIIGTDVGEVISGVPADPTINGVGSIDILTGLGGPDLFLLGNESCRYYDVGDLSSLGSNDFAYITDFQPDDKIPLFESPEDYVLGKGRFEKQSPKATIIYYRNPERPGQGASLRPWRNDEWIAMVVSDEPLNLNNLDQFQYIPPLG